MTVHDLSEMIEQMDSHGIDLPFQYKSFIRKKG